MRQTEIENMLKDHELRIKKIEDNNPLLVKVDGNEIKSITKIPQENNEQSVTKKGLPITKEGVVTTESGDGESPVDILTVEEIVNAHAIISKGMAEAEIVKDIKKGKK